MGEDSVRARTVALLEKGTSTIQYGRMKCGTHARVFLQILGNGNGKK